MSYLKLAFKKRPLKFGEAPQVFFERVAGDYAFLLERADGEPARADGEPARADGRYSYIGYDPFLFVWSQDGVVQIEQKRSFLGFKKSAARQMVEGDSLQVLRDLLKKFEYKGEIPVPFYGGAAGFFGYDYGCGFAGVEQKVFDDLKLPDFCLSFLDKVIAFDHNKHEICFLALGETDLAAKRKLEEIDRDLQRKPRLLRKGFIGELKSNLSKKQYLEKVAALKKLIKDGETYQVNFSQRFSADCTLDPWNVYKKLSHKSSAPFACYFQYPDFAIISSSPELLLRKRGIQLETWPIKGTVPRWFQADQQADQQADRQADQQADRQADQQADQQADREEKYIKDLLDSAKENAELTMIVDLERNDLGKVCEIGSVKVAEHRALQKLSHVIHTYSRVQGTLARKKDFFDALAAVFPGGSISGCPKKRTMEIIDRFEDYKRGVYTGSAGYISFSGDADLNILIRTMLLKDGKVYFQVGGGIVADSVGEKEYDETLHKAEGMKAALK